MGLKIETWSIAYRKKKEGLLFENTSEFIMINNGHKGWYADPFLFDYDGKTYLFAEYYSYDLGRGVLAYSVYDEENNCFNSFKEIIREEYHLSYPFVFNGKDGNIYLMPESFQSKQLYIYKAIDFPGKWEKAKVIIDDIRVVDTTAFEYNNRQYAFSLELDNKMLLLKLDNEFNLDEKVQLSNNMSYARAGGRVFEHKKKLIYVSQDCSEEYGKAINLMEFVVDNDNFIHKLIKKVAPEDIQLINGKHPSGIHTYNFSDKLEVIDLKFYRNSYYRLLRKVLK